MPCVAWKFTIQIVQRTCGCWGPQRWPVHPDLRAFAACQRALDLAGDVDRVQESCCCAWAVALSRRLDEASHSSLDSDYEISKTSTNYPNYHLTWLRTLLLCTRSSVISRSGVYATAQLSVSGTARWTWWAYLIVGLISFCLWLLTHRPYLRICRRWRWVLCFRQTSWCSDHWTRRSRWSIPEKKQNKSRDYGIYTMVSCEQR